MACATTALPPSAEVADPDRHLPARRSIRPTAYSAPRAVGKQIRATGKGLKQTYRMLVQNAFEEHLWAGTGTLRSRQRANSVLDAAGYNQDELNFSLFFGLAIDAYERTLISDQDPVRSSCEGRSSALTPQQNAGCELFDGQGQVRRPAMPARCSAAPRRRPASAEELIENMVMGDGELRHSMMAGSTISACGRPHEDIGVGGKDPIRHPAVLHAPVSGPGRRSISFPNSAGFGRLDRAAVDGAFKTPTLRNVALTAPYFHNGGEATLRGVVEFYNRGGNRRGPKRRRHDRHRPARAKHADRAEPGGSNLDPDIQPLGLTAKEMDALVEFLKALTDQRVACHAAPFDHPELVMPTAMSRTRPAAGPRTRSCACCLWVAAVMPRPRATPIPATCSTAT